LRFIPYDLLAHQCWTGCVADRSHELDSAGCQADTSFAHRSRSPSPLTGSFKTSAGSRATFANKFLSRFLPIAIMGYEDSVYLAKLAEQAERYEG
jgi:hypothetical protein